MGDDSSQYQDVCNAAKCVKDSPPAAGVGPFEGTFARGVRSPSSSGAIDDDWKKSGDDVGGRPFGVVSPWGVPFDRECGFD